MAVNDGAEREAIFPGGCEIPDFYFFVAGGEGGSEGGSE